MCNHIERSGSDHVWNKSISRKTFFKTMGVAAAAMAAGNRALSREPDDANDVMDSDDLHRIVLSINGKNHKLLVEPRWSLLSVLRDKLGYTGTKVGCGRGECGACTVLIDGIPRYACLTLAVEAEGHEITTLEGLMDGENMGPVQQAFHDNDGYQCGYCTPGQIMAAEGLLRTHPDPDMDEIQRQMSGNLCRCGAYPNIFKSVREAAKKKKEK